MLVESAILKPVQQETVTDIIGVIVIADDVATSIDVLAWVDVACRNLILAKRYLGLVWACSFGAL